MGQVFIKFESEQVQSERQNHEHSADPLGSLCELGIERLAAAHSGSTVAAGDGGRQTGALAGLHGNDRNECDSEKNLDNGQDRMQNIHVKFLQIVNERRAYRQAASRDIT